MQLEHLFPGISALSPTVELIFIENKIQILLAYNELFRRGKIVGCSKIETNSTFLSATRVACSFEPSPFRSKRLF